MKQPKKIAEQLQDAEISVLKQLKSLKKATVNQLSTKTNLQEVSVGRASLWLENKQLVKITKEKTKYVALDILGKKYAESILPEFRLLKLVKSKPLTLTELGKDLRPDELKFSIGYLKNKGLIIFSSGKAEATERGKRIARSLESDLLAKLSKSIEEKNLKPEERHAFLELTKRKQIVKTVEKMTISLEITPLGTKVASFISKLPSSVGSLTSDMLKTGDWKKTFRRYDVEAPVPRLFAGKKQPYLAFLDEVKKELTSMGFKEMYGPTVEASFFNCDALYMPQDHPARGIHDIYFVKGGANLAKYSEELSNVKETHENGGESGSTGWGYSFDREKAKDLMLPSQGTARSARMLMNKKLEIPAKYFAIARVFRPDVVDAKHLTEFNQMEGIVLGEDMNFRQLLSLLKDFAKKVANVDKVKFLPGYFPFTEPSVECFIKLDGKWIELLGAGIFRPELTKPLGIDVPVLAWGMGIERLFMAKEGVKDIRYLFSSDLDWLRRSKI